VYRNAGVPPDNLGGATPVPSLYLTIVRSTRI